MDHKVSTEYRRPSPCEHVAFERGAFVHRPVDCARAERSNWLAEIADDIASADEWAFFLRMMGEGGARQSLAAAAHGCHEHEACDGEPCSAEWRRWWRRVLELPIGSGAPAMSAK